MKIEIAKIAQKEFYDAKQFYEIEQSGLGSRFENEIKQSLIRIQQFPTAWPIEHGEIRHYIVHKFSIRFFIQSKRILF